MDFVDFLRSMVAGDIMSIAAAAGVTGGIVFGIIEFADKLAKRAQRPMSDDFKFWLAMGLSFVLPFVALFAAAQQTGETVTINAMFLAGGTGYLVSQGIHWVTEGSRERAEQKARAGGDAT